MSLPPSWWSDIRRFVAHADIEILKEALDGDLLHGACPHAAYIEHQGGEREHIRFHDGWWWSCPDCGVKGTRYLLETEVISDPDAVKRLHKHMQVRSVA